MAAGGEASSVAGHVVAVNEAEIELQWDAAGKDLTRQQVAHIPGAIPTVMVGGAEPGQ
jgi:hypothetical protein